MNNYWEYGVNELEIVNYQPLFVFRTLNDDEVTIDETVSCIGDTGFDYGEDAEYINISLHKNNENSQR